MGRSFNWGKRFGGPKVEGTRGSHLGDLMIPFNARVAGRALLRKERTRPIPEIISAAQNRSAKSRRERGIGKPSMPVFSFENQEILPPVTKRRAEVAEMAKRRAREHVSPEFSEPAPLATIRDLRRQLLIQEKGRQLLIEALEETRNALVDGKEEAAEAILASALERAGRPY